MFALGHRFEDLGFGFESGLQKPYEAFYNFFNSLQHYLHGNPCQVPGKTLETNNKQYPKP